MVSLDFPKQLESRLNPFIKENPMQATHILLNDPHQNEWINKVDPDWSGEIPFAILYNSQIRIFHSGAFHAAELDSFLTQNSQRP